MTENRRIFVNVIATYGRSVFALICGLFTARWVLLSLGEVDYGLYGVVGVVVVFITFLNSVLAGAISRFYAYSVGEARCASDKAGALEDCRRWFNTALSTHAVVPIVLVIIGYPIGAYAIQNWLTIPPDRIEACIWVLRLSCFSGLVGMINVPFSAMFTAKQNIAELTLYSFSTTVGNFCFCYYMVSHPGDWLVKYAAWMCLMAVLPQLVICMRGFWIFDECRVKLSYLFDWRRIVRIGSFAGWQLLGRVCSLLRAQGMTIVINKFFGPQVNASMTIATQVDAQTATLSSALLGAFSPAITTACGASDFVRMKALAFRACKFGTLLALVFSLPLALELPEVLRIWLRNPPRYATSLCFCMMAVHVVDVITNGHMVLVNASGKIAAYHVVLSVISIFTLPLAVGAVLLGFGVYSIPMVLFVMLSLNSLGRVYYARKILQVSVFEWARSVVLPILLVILFGGLGGLLIRLVMGPCFLRIVLTVLFTESILLPLSWFVVMDADERAVISGKIKVLRKRFT